MKHFSPANRHFPTSLVVWLVMQGKDLEGESGQEFKGQGEGVEVGGSQMAREGEERLIASQARRDHRDLLIWPPVQQSLENQRHAVLQKIFNLLVTCLPPRVKGLNNSLLQGKDAAAKMKEEIPQYFKYNLTLDIRVAMISSKLMQYGWERIQAKPREWFTMRYLSDKFDLILLIEYHFPPIHVTVR